MPGKRKSSATPKKSLEEVKLDRKYELASFWDDRYSKRKEQGKEKGKGKKEDHSDCEEGCWHDGATDDFLAKEWYFSYADIQPLLQPFLRAASKGGAKGGKMELLDLGCGISTFFEDMAKDGFQGHWVGVDFSAEAIRQMRETYPLSKYPTWDFVEADVRRMHTLASQSFDIIIDKALSDALICDVHQGKEALQKTYAEVNRLLKPTGVFVVVSLYSPEKEDDQWFLELLTESFLAEPKLEVSEDEKAPDLVPVEASPPKKARAAKKTPTKKTSSSSSAPPTPSPSTPSASPHPFKLKIVVHSSSEDGEEENDGGDNPNWMSSRYVYCLQKCRSTSRNSEPYSIEHKIH